MKSLQKHYRLLKIIQDIDTIAIHTKELPNRLYRELIFGKIYITDMNCCKMYNYSELQ